MQDIHHRLTETLQKRKDQNRFRSLATNSQLIDFSSNDYLGLARSEKLKRKIEEEIEKFSRKDAKAQSGDINGVFARGKIIQPIRQGYEVIIPDLLTVLCAFDNGAEGVLEFSGIDALAPSDRVEIYGSNGTLTYDFSSDEVQAGKLGDRGLHVVDLPAELETEWRVEEDFLAAVKSKGRVRPHPNFEDGLRYMRVVQAVTDSRARNEWVAIKR